MTTRLNYILVDFENVQPQDLGLLQDGPFQVKIFLGPNQIKIPVSLAVALQALGDRAEYIPLETAGNNALDFCIAYYIGVLSASTPNAFFHIISKDTGFDSLLTHLKGKKISAQRSVCIAEMPYFKIETPTSPPNINGVTITTGLETQIKTAIADLIRRKSSKPQSEKALINTLNALFRKALSEEQLTKIVKALHQRGFIKIAGTKISYALPNENKSPNG